MSSSQARVTLIKSLEVAINEAFDINTNPFKRVKLCEEENHGHPSKSNLDNVLQRLYQCFTFI